MLFALVGLALQLGKPQYQTGGNVFCSGQGWTIYAYPAEDQCDLTAEFTDGELLTVSYNAKADTSGIVVTNRHATSLAQDQKVPLNLVLLSKRAIISQNRVEFTSHLSGSQHVLVSDALDVRFIKNFGRADMFGLFFGNKGVAGSASLLGSAAATERLIACAEKAGGIDPLDPFRK